MAQLKEDTVNELIKRITERTGISEDQARNAAQAVIEFLKQKLPSGVSGQLDTLLASGEGAAGNLAQKAGSIFGKKG
jgi:hypothetical protein